MVSCVNCELPLALLIPQSENNDEMSNFRHFSEIVPAINPVLKQTKCFLNVYTILI